MRPWRFPLFPYYLHLSAWLQACSSCRHTLISLLPCLLFRLLCSPSRSHTRFYAQSASPSSARGEEHRYSHPLQPLRPCRGDDDSTPLVLPFIWLLTGTVFIGYGAYVYTRMIAEPNPQAFSSTARKQQTAAPSLLPQDADVSSRYNRTAKTFDTAVGVTGSF